jgi:hypothetical protein
MQKFLDFIKTKNGRIFISILWGVALASLFKKVCSDRKCVVYKAPNPEEMEKHVYGHNDKCYEFKVETTQCRENVIDKYKNMR